MQLPRRENSADRFRTVAYVQGGWILDGHRIRNGDTGGGIVSIEGQLISSVNERASGQTSTGGKNTLILPGLVNAHDHGRGLRRLDYGASDDALEVWLPQLAATHPAVDAYTLHALAFGRMARSGITTAVHCHVPAGADTVLEEAIQVCRAARDVGIRIAFVVPLRDQNYLAYGGDELFLNSLTNEDRDVARKRWIKSPKTPADQLAIVKSVAEACESDIVQVQLGPYGECWTSRPLLEAVASESAFTQRRIHMHCLETSLQRGWMDHNFPKGYFRYLDEIGFLSPRLTLAHGVWLRPEECELLAARGVLVSVNTCSNLRLRSGVAPVRDFVTANLKFGLGMDGLTLDDDDDALREMRLAHKVHAGISFDEIMTPDRLLDAATVHGATAATGSHEFGSIAPGRPADLLVLDYESMSRDNVSDAASEIDLLLGRATSRDVQSVIVAGQEIVRDGKLVGVDVEELNRELIDQCRRTANTEALPLLRRVQSALRKHYHCGCHLQHNQ
jgi:cytosine/adenosine deaminase-related metal-dependent hydrolase